MKTKFVVLLLMLIVLSACGYRGDLRLPPEGNNLVPTNIFSKVEYSEDESFL